MSSEPASTLPWSFTDARTTLLTSTLGAGLLLWGWWEASGTGDLGHQVTALMFAILAAGIVVAGSLAWITAGRRAVRARERALVELLEQRGLAGSVEATSGVVSGGLFTLPGSTRYHRRDCLLVVGKDAKAVSPRRRGRSAPRPCEMCRP